MYIIFHSLASSHPSPEFRSLQYTYESRSFPTPSNELASKRIRPLCLWGQWSNSRPAAKTVWQPPSPLTNVSLKKKPKQANKKPTDYTSVQPMRWTAFSALKWSFQIAGIWSHEGTWHPPFQPTRILQRLSNTTQRGKFQRCSHHFCNNYIFSSSMPLANMLNDAHPRINS